MTIWVVYYCEDGCCGILDCLDSAEKAYNLVYKFITHSTSQTYITNGLNELERNFSQNQRHFRAKEYFVKAVKVH